MPKTLIIAEAGVNHNGDISTAKKLVDVAANSGVDYIKFQTFKAETLVTKSAEVADYQKTTQDRTQYQMLQELELSESDHQMLIQYCAEKDVGFFSTAFDTEGLDYLRTLDFEMYKVPSGEITNYPYLKKLAGFNKPIILSTGMSTLDEIRDAIEVLTSESLAREDIIVLHCNTEYPTPMNDVNLKAMCTIAEDCNVQVGYSDHTLGIEVPIAAVALGARVIEKHFTLDRTLPGPDHKASLEPSELIEMVKAIRNIELAVSGSGVKLPSKSELKNIGVARKSIYTRRTLKKGQRIKSGDLIPLRPGLGLSPMNLNLLIGKTVIRDLDQNHMISWEDVK